MGVGVDITVYFSKSLMRKYSILHISHISLSSVLFFQKQGLYIRDCSRDSGLPSQHLFSLLLLDEEWCPSLPHIIQGKETLVSATEPVMNGQVTHGDPIPSDTACFKGTQITYGHSG